jgi:hypothetical protein
LYWFAAGEFPGAGGFAASARLGTAQATARSTTIFFMIESSRN